MKKSLVALAVLAATGAYAQSSVTLYGIVEATVDIGYNRTQESTTTTNTFNAAGNGLLSTVSSTNASQKNNFRIQDGNSQGTGTSRVGFRGTEDLGGGLKANFGAELGFRVDDGCATVSAAAVCSSGNSGGNLFGRNAWGGLSGGFGEVRLGRQVLGSFGVQGNSWSAGSSNGLYDAGAGTAPPMGGIRFSNAIRYMTPDFGGFKGSLMLSAPETNPDGDTFLANSFTSTTTAGVVSTTGASRRTGVDLALEYANGPAYIGFGYNKRDTGNIGSNANPSVAPVAPGTIVVNNNGLLTIGAVPTALAFPLAAVSPATVTGYTFGGSYDLGVVKPFVNYTRQKSDINGSLTFTGVLPANNFSQAVSGDVNARALSIGLRAPVGAFTVIAGYGRLNQTTNAVFVTSVVGASQTNAVRVEEKRDAFQLGAQYALSKRTLVEANYGYNRLNSNGTEVITTGPAAAGRKERLVRGTDRISALNVGLKHSF